MTIQVTVILYLLFPVEAASVTVGYIDVAVRLDDRQLETSQDTIEQFAAGGLKKNSNAECDFKHHQRQRQRTCLHLRREWLLSPLR